MSRVDDSEVIVFKRMSQDIIKNLNPIAAKLRVKIKKGVHCFNAIKEKFVLSENIEEVENEDINMDILNKNVGYDESNDPIPPIFNEI